jgi:hypothetical protein
MFFSLCTYIYFWPLGYKKNLFGLGSGPRFWEKMAELVAFIYWHKDSKLVKAFNLILKQISLQLKPPCLIVVFTEHSITVLLLKRKSLFHYYACFQMCNFVFANHCRLVVMSVSNNNFMRVYMHTYIHTYIHTGHQKIANLGSMWKYISKC